MIDTDSYCSIASNKSTVLYNGSTSPWQKVHKRKFTVTVEGNIGSGKSTFLKYFKQSNKVDLLQEPVEEWKNVGGYNTLDLLYKDASRWSLTFQSYVQLTMLRNHTYKQTRPVKLMERSIHSARYCFVENLYNAGLMPHVDYTVTSEWFDWIIKHCDVGVDLIVYLQASPEACLARIKERNRSEESSVPLEYLKSLHQLHEDWLIHQTKYKPSAPVLVLDAGKSLAELQLDLEKRREEILCGNV